MRVVEAVEFGGPEVLRVAERADPQPATGEVLVRVHAATVNPTDLAVRSGAARRRMPDLEPPFVPGWDLAGEVVESQADGYSAGDRVVGMIPWVRIGGRVGAYAEAVAVPADWLAPLADHSDYATGATLPLNALTARQGLDLIAASPGSRLLVTGASGAVGGYATQLAARDGLHVVALASTDDEEWVAGLGAEEVLPRGADLSALDPVDAVFDAVPIGPLATSPMRDGGAVLFTRSQGDFERAGRLRVETLLADSDPAALAALGEDLGSGRLKTRVAETLELAQAGEAHSRLEVGGVRGKIVLTS
jgi:NADPH:quinone reductase-like Zn-dependent oxidoreductase